MDALDGIGMLWMAKVFASHLMSARAEKKSCLGIVVRNILGKLGEDVRKLIAQA